MAFTQSNSNDEMPDKKSPEPTSSYLSLPLRSFDTAKKMKDLKVQLRFFEKRRNGERHCSNQVATAFVALRTSAISCTVRDISDSGVRLELDEQLSETPEKLFLYIDALNVSVECEPRWQRHRMMGLAFTAKNEGLCSALSLV